MSLSRKHFQALADIVREQRAKIRANACCPVPDDADMGADDCLDEMRDALAYFCADHNPNFDRARFLAACEPSKE